MCVPVSSNLHGQAHHIRMCVHGTYRYIRLCNIIHNCNRVLEVHILDPYFNVHGRYRYVHVIVLFHLNVHFRYRYIWFCHVIHNHIFGRAYFGSLFQYDGARLVSLRPLSVSTYVAHSHTKFKSWEFDSLDVLSGPRSPHVAELKQICCQGQWSRDNKFWRP